LKRKNNLRCWKNMPPKKGLPALHLKEYNVGSERNYGNADKDTSEANRDNLSDSEPESQEKSPENRHIKSTQLVYLTQKVCSLLICLIDSDSL
jgi:hypothetical protein